MNRSAEHVVPDQNPRLEQRIEGDKVVITATLYVQLDHLGRPWRIPVLAPKRSR